MSDFGSRKAIDSDLRPNSIGRRVQRPSEELFDVNTSDETLTPRYSLNTWNSVTTYSEGDAVFYGNALYQSLQDSNSDNQPDISPTYWQEFTLQSANKISQSVISQIGFSPSYSNATTSFTDAATGTFDADGEDHIFLLNASWFVSGATLIEFRLEFSRSGYATVYSDKINSYTNSASEHESGSWAVLVPGLGTGTWDVAFQLRPTTASRTVTMDIGDTVTVASVLTTANFLKGERGDAGVGVAWSSAVTYVAGDIVSYGNALYQGLLNSNLNNQPDTSPTYWTQVQLDISTKCAFYAHPTTAQTSVGAAIFADEALDVGGDYDHTTGVFTAPRDGIYHFTTGGIASSASARGRWSFQINDGSGWAYYNGADSYSQVYSDGDGTNYDHSSSQILVELEAGDQVRIYVVENGIYQFYSWFGGYEIRTGAKGDKGDPGIASAWDSSVTYSTGEVVTFASRTYYALQGSNLNKSPDTETDWWALFQVAETELAVTTLQHKLAPTVAPGTVTAGMWNTGPLNTKVVDPIGVELASNEFTLPAGKYYINAFRSVFYVDGYESRLYNVTDSTVAIYGGKGYANQGDGYNSEHVPIQGVVDIDSPKAFRVEVWAQTTRSSTGWGFNNASLSSDNVVWSQVNITKLDYVAPRGPKGDAGVGAVWASGTTYGSGDIVSYGTSLYQSLQGSNTGNQPDTSAAYWRAFSLSDTNITVSNSDPSGGTDGDIWIKVV